MKKKRVYRNFRYRECDSFAEYLHEMSLEGWHFTGWRAGLIFQEGEPEDIDYCVEVFPRGMEMDLKPDEDAQEYADYCEAAGWRLLDGRRRFCIFKKIREEAAEIVTPEERFANVRKAEWRQWGNESIGSILIAVLYLLQFFGRNFALYAFMDSTLLCCAFLILNVFWKAGEALRLLVWGRRTRRLLITGQMPEYKSKSKRNGIWNALFVFIFMIVFTCVGYEDGLSTSIILVPVVVGVFSLIEFLLAVTRPSRSDYQAIRIAIQFAVVVFVFMGACVILSGDNKDYVEISADEVDRETSPLILEDFTEPCYPMIGVDDGRLNGILGTRIHSSITYGTILESEYGVQEEAERLLMYDVYYSEYLWILDRIWEKEEKWYEDDAIDCTDLWDAEQAIQNVLQRYYVRYPDAILILYCDEVLNEAQIAVVREKLDL